VLGVRHFVLIFCCAASSCTLLPTYTSNAAAREWQSQSPDDRKSSSDKTTTTATAPAQSAEAKPAAKPKHVITNDDIKSSPDSGFGGVFYTNSGSINDCNADCFDQVRSLSMVDAGNDLNWRRDVLNQIEFVRSNGQWQAYLHELFNAHNKICQLNFDKSDELRRSGGTRNMGPQQVAITEKYDRSLGPAQAELSAAVARQSAEQKKFGGKPFANAFSSLQAAHMAAGFCSQSKMIFLQ
jgi:hypothetical protein